MKACRVLLCLFFLVSVLALADDQHHHDAYDPNHLGTVNFPTSCAAAVQPDFNKAVATLHSFWYEESEKQFESVVQRDPNCAMAYWGVVMSRWHQLWSPAEPSDIAASQKDLKTADAHPPKTARERAFLAAAHAFYDGDRTQDERATAYSDAMAKLHQQYPSDIEGTVFYALSLLASSPSSDTAKRQQAVALLQPIFDRYPNHPGVAHYIIHSCDSPAMAPLALRAAREYAKIAPSAPHALHMPSHIFSQLGLWQDSIKSNLASVAATRHSMAMNMGGGGHQLHAMDFLEYAYLQSGQEDKAQALIGEATSLHDMPGWEMAYSRAMFNARYDIEMRHWKDAAAIAVPEGANEGTEAIVLWARALGAARSGNPDAAQSDIARLKKMEEAFRQRGSNEGDDMAVGAQVEREEAEAFVLHARGKDDEAIATLRSAAELEEKHPSEAINIPARELLGDLQLEAGRASDALETYELSNKLTPNRFNGLYGAARAAEAAGNHALAQKYYAQLLKTAPGSQRPELAEARAAVAKTAAGGQ